MGGWLGTSSKRMPHVSTNVPARSCTGRSKNHPRPTAASTDIRKEHDPAVMRAQEGNRRWFHILELLRRVSQSTTMAKMSLARAQCGRANMCTHSRTHARTYGYVGERRRAAGLNLHNESANTSDDARVGHGDIGDGGANELEGLVPVELVPRTYLDCTISVTKRTRYVTGVGWLPRIHNAYLHDPHRHAVCKRLNAEPIIASNCCPLTALAGDEAAATMPRHPGRSSSCKTDRCRAASNCNQG